VVAVFWLITEGAETEGDAGFENVGEEESEAATDGDGAGVFHVGTDKVLSGTADCIAPVDDSDGFVFQVGVVEIPDGARDVCAGEEVFQVGVVLNSPGAEGAVDGMEVTMPGADGAAEPGDGMATNGMTGAIMGAGDAVEGTWVGAPVELGE